MFITPKRSCFYYFYTRHLSRGQTKISDHSGDLFQSIRGSTRQIKPIGTKTPHKANRRGKRRRLHFTKGLSSHDGGRGIRLTGEQQDEFEREPGLMVYYFHYKSDYKNFRASSKLMITHMNEKYVFKSMFDISSDLN